MLKQFTYIKNPEDISQRIVFELSPASDNRFCIDLSEFDKEERDYYEAELQKLKNGMKATIEDLGLKQNYRYFKESKISNEIIS